MSENRLDEKTVMLILTENCNLACTYCYEHNKSDRRMTFETAKKIINKELTKDDGYNKVYIEFFGGEPFLEFNLIKKVHEYIFSHKWNKKVLCFATTNGTLIHGKIKEWLRDNKDTMWVALSLDGTREMHNKNRCNSYDDIDVEFFHKTWPTQTCKMTISKETLPNLAEGVMYLEKIGYPFTCGMAQGINWDKKENLEILKAQVKKLVDYYIENPEKKVCDLLNVDLRRIATENDKKIKWCGVGEQMIAYDIEGNFYPCQAFAPQTLGDESKKFKNTMSENFTNGFEDENCKDCIIYPICGTCYGANYILYKDYKKRDKNMCEFNKVCILASAYIKYYRYSKKKIDELSIDEALELKAIQKLQTLDI